MENGEELKLPCAEKMTFDSRKEAEGAATALQWQHGSQLKAYKCTNCGLWHLSSA